MYLIDTTVWIDHLRGNEKAAQYLENVQEMIALSVLSVAELGSGARKMKDQSFVDGLQDYFEIIPVDFEIARLGGAFYREYNPSHGSGIVDCLLAATAKIKGLKLVTHNAKHFPMVDVVVPY